MIFHGDCEEFLDANPQGIACIFMDPPDNLGLEYNGYKDKRDDYYGWLERLILKSIRLAPVVWISYYWAHDIEIKHRVRNILKFRHPSYEPKSVLWRYTFGQHKESDFGSGFRYMLRLKRMGHPTYTDEVREESERQRMGDKRANPDGRVPDDVWDVPRVTGNSAERRSWHPTQHPERLMDRVITSSTRVGERFVDLFGGTGTTLRCCRRLNRRGLVCELSEKYVCEMEKEHSLTRISDPASPF